MPDRFATAACVNPAARCQCSYVFRQMRRAIVSAGPRRMARIFSDLAQRVPGIMTVSPLSNPLR